MPTQFPPEVTFGVVKARLSLGIDDDESDPDLNPNRQAAVGTVTFTPTSSMLLILNTGDIVFPKPIVATLDVDGYFEETLIANENPEIAPFDWGWNVSFQLAGVSEDSYPIKILDGEVKWLADLTPVPSPTGTDIMRGPAGPPGVSYITLQPFETVEDIPPETPDGTLVFKYSS